MKNHRILHAVNVVVIGTMLSACSAALHSPETPAMTQTTTQAKPETTTYCFGRFVIDVPAGSKISGGTYKYDFAQIEKPAPTTLEQFKTEVRTREDHLRSTRHEKDPSLLRTTSRPDDDSAVMAYWEYEGAIAVVNVDGYKWGDDSRFLLRAEASEDRQAKAVARMADRLSHLRARADTDIPNEPGYCFGGGFIANEEWKNEEVGLDFRIAGHEDVRLSIDIMPLAASKRDKPLLERMGGVLQQIGNLASQVRVLRERDRQLGAFKGQEYLVAAPNSGGSRGHLLTWETQGEGTLDTPHIEIEMSTSNKDGKGNPQQTRLTDEQALQLWDRIIGSFRLRPVSESPRSTSEAPAPKAALGEVAATGRACPQTGWWLCQDEILEVQGGRRRFFRTGEPMPHVVVLGERSLWQKLEGDVPASRVATVWELVDYGLPEDAKGPATDGA